MTVRHDIIRNSLSFRAFAPFVRRLSRPGNPEFIGILSAARTLYHHMTVGDVMELFSNELEIGMAVICMENLSSIAERLGIPEVKL